MTQSTRGLRSVLSLAWAYRLWQLLLGGKRGFESFVDRYMRLEPGDAVLDIGCGPATVLGVLPEGVEYVGFDQSEKYVEAARRRFGGRGTFLHVSVREMPLAYEERFDLAIALGVLHHLDDDEAVKLFALAERALKPGGRLLTLDGAYDDRQSRLARWALSWDRGGHVRDRQGYEALARRHFGVVESEILHDLLWFPYTHIIMNCRR